MRIKQGLGKLRLPANFADVLAAEPIEPLAVTHFHAHAIEKLPPIHRDPFDRLLIAQAKSEGLTIVTRDQVFQRYGISAEIV
jgi:PIN domain nuclease of toxin-antitoxin system